MTVSNHCKYSHTVATEAYLATAINYDCKLFITLTILIMKFMLWLSILYLSETLSLCLAFLSTLIKIFTMLDKSGSVQDVCTIKLFMVVIYKCYRMS
jgi:hypothetical protein